ncbi:MAG: tungsten ABC transporter permease [Burkholderiaceae bacterium]|nr:tungsten ABC transporter permease [Burkholderiaceae bacterium]
MTLDQAGRRRLLRLATAPALAGLTGCAGWAGPPAARVDVAVVGGLSLCGVWPRVAEAAGASLGLELRTVAAAPKEGVVPAMADGRAQLLLIHASDEAMGLEAADLASAARVWGWNQHVFAGPSHDPAGVRGAADGIEAMHRIVDSGSPFIGLRDPGSYAVVQRLWRHAGIRPDARWLRADTGPRPQAVLQLAAELQAYAVVGHIPLHFGKMGAEGISLLLQGDPLMRRPYVLLAPGPRHGADAAQRHHAARVAEHLLSARGQQELALANAEAAGPWIFGRDSMPLVNDAPTGAA